MGKSKTDGKAKGKGSQLVIRIDKAEREAFVTLCDRLDTSAAREIRRFMRGFVASHETPRPGSDTAPPETAAMADLSAEPRKAAATEAAAANGSAACGQSAPPKAQGAVAAPEASPAPRQGA